MTLEDDIDPAAGTCWSRENNQPDSVQDLDARICWLSEQPMRPGTRFEVRHTSREAVVKEVVYKLDINTLHRIEDDIGGGDERHRPGPHPYGGAVVGRRLPPQPGHRVLHPCRSWHPADGGGRWCTL